MCSLRLRTNLITSYGIHLIYSKDRQRNQDDEDNHMPMLPNLLKNSSDNISTSHDLKRRREDEDTTRKVSYRDMILVGVIKFLDQNMSLASCLFKSQQ